MTVACKTTAISEQLHAIADAQPFITRFLVRNLQTGETIGRGENEETPSASTRKTSIMMAALKAAHEGRLDLDAPITYEERLKHEVASGMFRYMTPGIVIPLRDAIVGMMVLSDNVCTKMVLERLTLEEVDGYCKAIGMAGSHHRFLIPPLGLKTDHSLGEVTTTTASDQILLLEAILAAENDEAAAARLGTSVEFCRFALQTLKNQVLRYGIRSRLPFEAVVASKSGRGKRGRMDTGLVYRDNRPLYGIAVFTDAVPQVMADGTPGYTIALETIGLLSKACWDAF